MRALSKGREGRERDRICGPSPTKLYIHCFDRHVRAHKFRAACRYCWNNFIGVCGVGLKLLWIYCYCVFSDRFCGYCTSVSVPFDMCLFPYSIYLLSDVLAWTPTVTVYRACEHYWETDTNNCNWRSSSIEKFLIEKAVLYSIKFFSAY